MTSAKGGYDTGPERERGGGVSETGKAFVGVRSWVGGGRGRNRRV